MATATPEKTSLPSGPTQPALRREGVLEWLSPFYWGVWALLIGVGMYLGAILLSMVRLALLQPHLFVGWIAKLLWASGFPTTVGIALIALDLGALLPIKRRGARKLARPIPADSMITVSLTAYNDELSVAAAVQDFLAHPRVKRVIVVSNNSQDRTLETPEKQARSRSTKSVRGTDIACIGAFWKLRGGRIRI